jgi:hypothetical protein
VAARARLAALAGTAALALVATLVSLAALEVAVRLLGLETASYHAIGGFTTYDPVLGWKLAPSRRTIFRGAHFAVRVAQNAEGLRARHYDYARTPDRRRILVLGDSVVWCWGVEQADCFTTRLEAALRDTDVVNAGVPAWSTAQETLFYEHEGRRYAPDLVLLVFVPNDPYENVAGPGPHFRRVGDRLRPPDAPAPRRKSVVGAWLMEHSAAWAQLGYLGTVVAQTARWRAWPALRRLFGCRPTAEAAGAGPTSSGAGGNAASPGGAGAPPSSRAAARDGVPEDRGLAAGLASVDDRQWAMTTALLDRLAADVRADGARFAVVSEVTPKPMAARLRAWCAARAVPLLELGPALWSAEQRGERVRLVGDPHIGPSGQAIVAAEVLAFVQRERLLPDAPAAR